MRETGSEGPRERKSAAPERSQERERSYRDGMEEVQGRAQSRDAEGAGESGESTRENPARAQAERLAEGERSEVQRPAEASLRTEVARPAEVERSYVGRVRQAEQTERPVLTDRPAETEPPVEAEPPAEAERPEGPGIEASAEAERPPEPPLTSEVAEYADASDRPVEGSRRGIDTLDQGQLNNCYFVASVNAIAHRDPEWVGRVVQQNAQGDVVVDLGERRPMAPTLPHAENAAVPPQNEWGDVYGHAPDGSTGGAYLEKWFAEREGGYEKINAGRWPRETLAALTEREAYHRPVSSLHDTDLSRVLGPECAAVASSRDFRFDPDLKDLARKYGLPRINAHAYAVQGLDDQDRVVLRNPWGVQHPRPVPRRDFRELFSSVDWCDMPRKESQ
jgi:hypothetical protein